ncbi:MULTISPECIES: ArsR/SmtB family transcription factor [Bacillus]|uniref:ArsR/SmtB family transcription factor n=1 Tax=Bacillus TaxID=1386 RepID=UPI00084A7904|nr:MULTISPECIES: metalloregulator ArsR/SmtB family transcription factor [Bacillus]MBL4966536.1 winged helix-turn-helix transcriptional regulator [Bacillus halotolerans]MDL5610608.1 metalloregulator ArsR/SmtB family transcription factor [Bacillus halotolerans]OEC79275.1 transcriptional regulator [Bacillus halotolerans]UZD50917.1 metalloregulator ArsR/SmtB family transcription factor [Bacillus halotolerans]WEY44572.1 metalloregulator ArsR/SmtB family transcription factor [Bacillus sp. B28]
MKHALTSAEISHCLKLLHDQTRLLIMKKLEEKAYCVCQFVDMFDVSQPAISQHLRKLKQAGFVNEEKKGQWRFYSINSACPEYGLIQSILGHISSDDDVLQSIQKKETQVSCK